MDHSDDSEESTNNYEESIDKLQELNTSVKQELTISSNDMYNEAQYNFDSITMLENIQQELTESSPFLSNYLKVLTSKNKTTISYVTDNIITSIEHTVVRLRDEPRVLTESDMTVLVCWLCAASLWDAPRVDGARAALHALLPLLTEQEIQHISEIWCRAASPPALLALSDVVRGAPALAARLVGGAGGAGGAGGEGGALGVRREARRLRAPQGGGGGRSLLDEEHTHTDLLMRHAILKLKMIME